MEGQNLDTWSQIFQYLTPQEFINRCTVDKTFAATCDSTDIWTKKLRQDYRNILKDKGQSYVRSFGIN